MRVAFAGGLIEGVDRDCRPDPEDQVIELLLPGIPNLHSHAFQRAMAGRAERRAAPQEDFWSWRGRMYRLAERLTPDMLRAIAAQVYVEMLEAGYTSVAEFHYLHNGPEGQGFVIDETFSTAIMDAARIAGIRLTLLPVFYEFGGFGGAQPSGAQRRFALSLDEYRRLQQHLTDAARGADIRVGCALHSLRAVGEMSLQEIASWQRGPVHVHVAEQSREVEESLGALGKRPVAWLLERISAPDPWCFVHATHVTDEELQGMANAGVTVALCPSTEANLGDGLFPLADFVELGGRFGIGSDSQVCVDPFEELRWLEYGQRLRHQQRHIGAHGDQPHTGTALFAAALDGGASALGQPVGRIAPGCAADFLAVKAGQASLAGVPSAELLDALIFAPGQRRLGSVMVAGEWRVVDGQHKQHDLVLSEYRSVLQ